MKQPHPARLLRYLTGRLDLARKQHGRCPIGYQQHISASEAACFALGLRSRQNSRGIVITSCAAIACQRGGVGNAAQHRRAPACMYEAHSSVSRRHGHWRTNGPLGRNIGPVSPPSPSRTALRAWRVLAALSLELLLALWQGCFNFLVLVARGR